MEYSKNQRLLIQIGYDIDIDNTIFKGNYQVGRFIKDFIIVQHPNPNRSSREAVEKSSKFEEELKENHIEYTTEERGIKIEKYLRD